MTILSNKVAIVAGASTGIGYATAKLFAREGAAVVVAARRKNLMILQVQSRRKAGKHWR